MSSACVTQMSIEPPVLAYRSTNPTNLLTHGTPRVLKPQAPASSDLMQLWGPPSHVTLFCVTSTRVEFRCFLSFCKTLSSLGGATGFIKCWGEGLPWNPNPQLPVFCEKSLFLLFLCHDPPTGPIAQKALTPPPGVAC